MEINKTLKNEKEMEVEIIGRLDTTTAPELEAALKDDLANLKSLVLNFADLEYVSSAGLRVILIIQKTITANGGSLVLKKVNDDVMSVFDMTGFSTFLKFED